MDPNNVNTIVNAMEEEIVFGTLQPGDLLQQEVLAKRFGVSRQPVRAALEILGARNLVTRRPDRTVQVHGLSESASEEILNIRRLLEAEALSLAFEHLSERDLLSARQALEQFEIERDYKKVAYFDTAFHLSLYRPCGNETLIQLISDLRQASIRTYLGQPLGSNTRAQCINSHRAILAACNENNKDQALSLLASHFNITKDRTQ